MTAAIVRLLALVAIAALPACGGMPPFPGTGGERIWDTRAQRYVSEPEVVAVLVVAPYRLLGELHDNPHHHAARARLIAALAARGVRPAVAMEQFVRDHDDALQAAQRAGGDAEGLADAGRLDRKGWAWPLHKPIVDAAVAAGLPVRATNLPRTALRGDLQARVDAVPGEPWARRLRESTWTEAQAQRLHAKIVDGHCGKLPDRAIPGIALAQRARDAAMAQALLDSATADGAILIAGNGHVRRDLGVPAYVDPGVPMVSVGFVEDDDLAPATAGPAPSPLAAGSGYDYVWITDGVARDDPCVSIVVPPAPAGAPRTAK